MRLIGLVLAFSLTLLPLAARAQESGKVYKIGWLAGFPLEAQGKTRPGSAVAWRAFTDGLRDLGWVENQGRRSDILASRQSSLSSSRTSSARARANWRFVHSREPPRRFRSSCRSRPIQWQAGVASLARPAGNATGLSILAPAVGAKRLQLLKEVVPNASRVAVLWNAGDPSKDLELKETPGQNINPKIGLQRETSLHG